jgi:hypothetical protein
MFHVMGQCMPDLSPDLQHARITTLLGLVTEALASRARVIDTSPADPSLDDDMFLTNLIDMSLGALVAPSTIRSKLN